MCTVCGCGDAKIQDHIHSHDDHNDQAEKTVIVHHHYHHQGDVHHHYYGLPDRKSVV